MVRNLSKLTHANGNNRVAGRPFSGSRFLEPDERKIRDYTPEEVAARQKSSLKVVGFIFFILGLFLIFTALSGKGSGSLIIFGCLMILLGIGLFAYSSSSGVIAGVGGIIVGIFLLGAVWLFPENSDKIVSGSISGGVSILGGIITIVASYRARNTAAEEQSAQQEREPEIEGYCVYCNYPIRFKGYRYCPSCGAKLITLDEGKAALTEVYEATTMKNRKLKTERAPTCKLCGQELKSGEKLIWCPYCGKPAHRAHLLKWVHENSSCPSCGRQLDEKRLAQQSPATSKTSERSKRSTAQKGE